MTNVKKTCLISLGIVAAASVAAGAIIYYGSEGKDEKFTSEDSSQEISLEVSEKDHIRGDVQAPVTIVEYSDLQCPFCQKFHPVLKEALEKYPDKIRWVYRHFPLESIHSEAKPAAMAAECAGEQGKFFEFVDKIFENQERMRKSLYNEIAQVLGINIAQFEECVLSEKYKDVVEADFQKGLKAGVRGTPTSFINGEPLVGAVSLEELKAAIDGALQ